MPPFFSSKRTLRTFTGDCLEAIELLRKNNVTPDLVFTSPPYENARSYGDVKFGLRGQAWVDWASDRYHACNAICRGLTAWVVEGTTTKFKYSATPMLLAANLHMEGVKLRKPPIYYRSGIAGSGGPDWLRNDYEFILCSSHGKLPWSDNTAMGQPPKYGPGGAMSHHGKNGRVAKKTYVPPEKANPGNVYKGVDVALTLPGLAGILRDYANATKADSREVLRTLQQAIDSKAVPRWFLGVCYTVLGQTVLRPNLYGPCREDVECIDLSCLQKNVPSKIAIEPVLFGQVLPQCGREEATCDSHESGWEGEGTSCNASKIVSGLRQEDPASGTSHRRKPKQQRSGQSASSVSVVPQKTTSAASSQLPDMWETADGVRALRKALPQIQAVWKSAVEMHRLTSLPEAYGGSSIISSVVGGGHMGGVVEYPDDYTGSDFAKSNEAPFSEKLAEFFIRSFCPPGGVVFDPFCGSGTTLAVANALGRYAVGCDIREDQVELTNTRCTIATKPKKFPAWRR